MCPCILKFYMQVPGLNPTDFHSPNFQNFVALQNGLYTIFKENFAKTSLPDCDF